MLVTDVFIDRFDPNSVPVGVINKEMIMMSIVMMKMMMKITYIIFSELRPMIEEGKDKLEWTRQVS